jgi:hypothetical protein
MWDPSNVSNIISDGIQRLRDASGRTQYVWSPTPSSPPLLAIPGLDGPTYRIERGLLIITTVYGEREVMKAPNDVDFVRDLNQLFINNPYITMKEIHSCKSLKLFATKIYSSTWLVGNEQT